MIGFAWPGRLGAAAALALAAGAAGASCIDTARIASLGVRGDAILLIDADDTPFAIVGLWPGDAARLPAARRIEPIRGRVCGHQMLFIVDGRLIMARDILLL